MGLILQKKPRQGRIFIEHRQDLNAHHQSHAYPGARYKVSEGSGDLRIFHQSNHTASIGFKARQVDTGVNDIRLNSQTSVGRILKNYEANSAYKTKLSGGKVLAASLSYGSTSDRPFKNARDSTINANLAYAFSPENFSQWVLLINYSNNRGFLNNIPIPAFAYIYRNSSGWIYTFGIPFAFITYVSPKKELFRFAITPGSLLYQGNTALSPGLFLTHEISYRAQGYLHSEREDDEERFFLVEKNIEVGLKQFLGRRLNLSLSTGLSFDRNYYEATNIFSNEGETYDIANDYYLKSSFNFTF